MVRVQLSVTNAASFDERAFRDNKRRPGRMRCAQLGCRRGRVMDLSYTGARIRIKSWWAPRPAQRRKLTFDTAMGESMPVACRVVWARRIFWRRYELGVEFVDLTEPQREQLAEIARVHGVLTIFDGCEEHAA